MTGRDGEAVFLEVKCRIGARREKARIDFPMTGVELAPRLFDLEVSRLAQELFPQLGYILPAGMFPAFEVRYHRYRFVDPRSGARLCVDSEITAPHVHPSRPATGFQRRLPAVVVEIKDKHAEIPFHLGRLTDLCLRKCSFSKYATCASVLF